MTLDEILKAAGEAIHAGLRRAYESGYSDGHRDAVNLEFGSSYWDAPPPGRKYPHVLQNEERHVRTPWGMFERWR